MQNCVKLVPSPPKRDLYKVRRQAGMHRQTGGQAGRACQAAATQ